MSDIPDDYPWSIPGYHDEISRHTHFFGVIQERGTPNQFTFCTDCPCPTPKSAANTSVSVKQKNANHKLRKAVVHFDNASFQLSKKHKATLTHLYQSLPEHYQLTITGYTDDTTPGGMVTNELLAQQRAQAVFNFLISLGLDKQHASVKAAPLCCYVSSNDTDAGRALNRRTEILISSSLSTQR